MLIFVRNSSTNLLPLLLGLFFKISGTSSRAMSMLSNIGLCVSVSTVERLKVVISEDAVEKAVTLMTATDMLWGIIFDNINIYSRKEQQRITNQNEMLNITNIAVQRLDDNKLTAQEIAEARDLQARLNLRGERSKASAADLRPTQEDEEHMRTSFENIIMDIIVTHCPGNRQWENRKLFKEEIKKHMPRDRPLEPRKSDARPFGVVDVNEGSKKGTVKVLEAIVERSKMTRETWEEENRIVGGDWGTVHLIRGARQDRMGDITVMDRLENVAETSLPFHVALQISHGLMRSHYGQLMDPTSLADHKAILNRTWDVKKPNYAAAKALVRHSLIARILHIVM